MSEEAGDVVVAETKPEEVTEKKSAAKKPKAAKKTKPKTADTHPKYCQMIAEAINALKERTGSSRQAILKYIMANYSVDKDERVVNNHLKMSLRAGIKNGAIKQLKGVGASGSFKIGDKASSKGEKKKPQAKKSATPSKQKPKTSGKALNKVKKPKAAASKAKKSPKKAKSSAKSSEKKSPKKSPQKSKKAAKKPTKKVKKGKAAKAAASESDASKEGSASE